VLYLIARYAGATTAREVACMFGLQWHQYGLTPYIMFEGKREHGDAEIQRAQQWLSEYCSVANRVVEMIERSRRAKRTVKRRFAYATWLTPIV
jgi:transcriptional regulator GlxA family with amidase domain